MIKWHDLEKNPTDLPKDYDGHGIASKVVVVAYRVSALENVSCENSLGYYDYEKRMWKFLRGDAPVGEKIERWAYLEYTEDAKPSPQHDLTELRDALIKGVENVSSQIQEFAVTTRKNGDSFSEALTCALIGYMESEVKYGILKEFAEHGETD